MLVLERDTHFKRWPHDQNLGTENDPWPIASKTKQSKQATTETGPQSFCDKYLNSVNNLNEPRRGPWSSSENAALPIQ